MHGNLYKTPQEIVLNHPNNIISHLHMSNWKFSFKRDISCVKYKIMPFRINMHSFFELEIHFEMTIFLTMLAGSH